MKAILKRKSNLYVNYLDQQVKIRLPIQTSGVNLVKTYMLVMTFMLIMIVHC